MTMPHDDLTALDWAVRVEDVPARGLNWSEDANEAQRRRLSTALNLVDVVKLVASGRIKAIAGGTYRLDGRLQADVIQACVVSLEPVPAHIDEPLRIEFRPDGDIGDELASTPNYDEETDIEPIMRGKLELGRIVYETLSASLDPYPRATGSGIPLNVASKPKEANDGNPFAILAKLKDKS